jgi:magnesium-protoporphyrin IX monomethyl ester (oxidative) cyclase
MVRFDRHSPYFSRREEYQLDLAPMDFYYLTYPFPDPDIRQLAYFFRDTKISPYLEQAVSWIGRLSQAISDWRDGWRSAGSGQPELSLERHADGTGTVGDSRFGSLERYELGEDEVAVLARLVSPGRRAELAGELGLLPARVADLLDRLADRKLVFAEGDLVMSLVITEDDMVSERSPAMPTIIR